MSVIRMLERTAQLRTLPPSTWPVRTGKKVTAATSPKLRQAGRHSARRVAYLIPLCVVPSLGAVGGAILMRPWPLTMLPPSGLPFEGLGLQSVPVTGVGFVEEAGSTCLTTASSGKQRPPV